MDFERIETFDNGVTVKNIRNFELPHVFDCGQCFRWNRQENGNYIGVAYNRVIELKKNDSDLIIYNATEDDFNSIWINYFDLFRDYSNIKDELSKDELLRTAVKFGHGIRILQQQPLEIIVSFIISANNRIPMIKRAVENICRNWGEPIKYKENVYYGFPDLEKLNSLSIEDFEKCGTGFRAKYIKNTIEKIYNGEDYSIEKIKCQSDDICHKKLQEFPGIGPKVADCIMLFSMGKQSAFPVDVWVKRAMQHFYLAPDVSLKKIRDFSRNKFGKLSGFAQQYLFYYARENNIKV